MLKNIRTQNNKIKQRSYTRNHSIQGCKIDGLLAITTAIRVASASLDSCLQSPTANQ